MYQFIITYLDHPFVYLGQVVTGCYYQYQYKKKPGDAWNKFLKTDLLKNGFLSRH
jgi:hypothetical protein